MIHNLGKVKAATLMSHAFNDWNVMPEHSNRIYQALKKKGVPCMTFYHQGGHGGPPPASMVNRWFTRYLYGIKNDVENGPRAWIVREGKRRTEPTPYADYPNPDAEAVTLYPSKSGNKVGRLFSSRVSFSPRRRPSTEKLIDDVSFTGAKLAAAGSSKHRLLYATPELTAPLHLSGTARINIRVSSSAKAANLSVWLVSLPWTKSRRINDNLISRGWADPQNHESLTSSKPLKKGKFYELSFDLQPDDQVIPAGQKIGLMIFSSDRDFTVWPPAGTILKVDLGATSLILPIVGGAKAFNRATSKPKKQ
jgi:X-Pro dipeptidyl-peptidase